MVESQTPSSRVHKLPVDLLVNRFASLSCLSDEERKLLRVIQTRGGQSFSEGSTVAPQGERLRVPLIITSGWAGEVREVTAQRLHIASVLLPGDVIGLERRWEAVSPARIVALSHLQTAAAPELAHAWRGAAPHLGLARALDLAAEERDWFRIGHAARLSRQTALERMANLLAEIHLRLRARGLAAGDAFKVPMTQEQLADATGLSVVHVNRTLQKLRHDGLIWMQRGTAKVLDVAQLWSIAQFVEPPLAVQANSPGPVA